MVSRKIKKSGYYSLFKNTYHEFTDKKNNQALIHQQNSFIDSLQLFITKVNNNPDKPVVIISSTTKRIGIENRINRPMAFSKVLAQMDIPIIYVYYRFRANNDQDSDYNGSWLLQIPNDIFHQNANFDYATFFL